MPNTVLQRDLLRDITKTIKEENGFKTIMEKHIVLKTYQKRKQVHMFHR